MPVITVDDEAFAALLDNLSVLWLARTLDNLGAAAVYKHPLGHVNI